MGNSKLKRRIIRPRAVEEKLCRYYPSSLTRNKDLTVGDWVIVKSKPKGSGVHKFVTVHACASVYTTNVGDWKNPRYVKKGVEDPDKEPTEVLLSDLVY
jgi:hypothetical protein